MLVSAVIKGHERIDNPDREKEKAQNNVFNNQLLVPKKSRRASLPFWPILGPSMPLRAEDSLGRAATTVEWLTYAPLKLLGELATRGAPWLNTLWLHPLMSCTHILGVNHFKLVWGFFFPWSSREQRNCSNRRHKGSSMSLIQYDVQNECQPLPSL